MYTPSEIADLLECEHRSVLGQANAAGIAGAPQPGAGPDRVTVKHGREHERATLTRLRGEQHAVVEIDSRDPVTAAAETAEALRAGVPVVYQAVFHEPGGMTGRADFLVRGDDGRYEVYDTKLARHARPAAVIQVVAYADALARAGHPAGPETHLLLGDGSRASFRVDEFLPLLRRLQQRLLAREPHLPDRLWGDERPACSGCPYAEHCAAGRAADRDLALVAGMRSDQRRKLVDGGLTTIDALAAASPEDRPTTLSLASYTALRAQAAIQVRQDATGEVAYEVVDPDALATIPPPSPGDVFFDMEGDPYAIGGTGLEYLFGAVADDTFTPFWAHTRAAERRAFERFVDFATARLAEHPDAHVYHYAPYESSALKRLAALHGTREDAVDRLLRHGSLIDLYAVVRKALRVSQRTYSIKALEPLYMPEAREGEVKTAVSSIEAYEDYLTLTTAGETERAAEILQGIADYNEYDCVSTQRLFEFLHQVRREEGIETRHEVDESELDAGLREVQDDERARKAEELARLVDTLIDGLPDDPADFTPDDRARALLAASVGYYRRETNPAWWEYFRQLAAPLHDLEADTTCAVPVRVDAGEWEPPKRRNGRHKRVLRVVCDQDRPHPFAVGDQVRLRYGADSHDGKVTEATADRIVVEESRAPDAIAPGVVQAVLPGEPVRPAPKDEAVLDLAKQVADALPAQSAFALAIPSAAPALPQHPGIDLLRRTPPRLRGGGALPAPGDDLVRTVIETVDALDGSTLAVQGPPGAGKTYLAGRLIAHLVKSGRTVGVTSTSHKAVENVLTAALSAAQDLPVAKRPRGTTPAPDVAWDQPKNFAALAGWRREHDTGHLVGGTAWNFANKALREDPFDVLIVDEAGQFALADALAVSTCARNLVLLGDPRQLPQVVQGTHPAGAEASALGHLLGAADIIPPDLGFFLDQTRRMHPDVCAPVSRLSYAGRLHAHPSAAERSIAGVVPGLHVLEVDHRGNTTRSTEEAAAVAELVTMLHGRAFDDRGSSRPIGDRDILVVAPYNLQARVVTRALAAAGHPDVRVGTVDRFQGQEAPVVIATMTSSSAADLPRGLDFLLSRNRLNVALSRAQTLAVLVCSPHLVTADIRTTDQMRLVSGMIGLLDDAIPWVTTR
ncbi:TM0106 family RecB-like putative nuclease [Actinokineospora globicatena]|uniref:ATPase n=1 Tax=Actinokineospora globicatena TaxID=103729 RepID=A0A9W6QJ26_9PSEU|nr:TM0106 family RecB-like putative nuclease [Actinokineospora globicatena]GLW90600.1 ATPase [Actinokineospora globicatena]